MKQIIAVAVLLLAAGSAQAQAASTDAYFQWMNAITDDTLTPRMAAHLNAAGVRGHEQEQVAAILSAWKAAEASLEATDGAVDANQGFYAKQAALVQATIDRLRITLAAASFQRIDNRVQHEAGNIQIARTNHSMLHNAAFHPQMPPPMNPNYHLYTTSADGPILASITGSMITQTGGFGQWNPSNLVDGNTSDVGFSTDTTQANQYFGITFSTPQDITELSMYLSAANYAGQFDIYYGDGNGYTRVGLPNYFAPTAAGYNYQDWPDAGAHTQWVVQLMNTPGAGPTINELQLVQPGSQVFVTASLSGNTSCPQGCNSAVHQGIVVNTLGATISGAHVAPTAYINVVNSRSMFLPVGGGNPPPTVGTGGHVECSIVGPIQNFPTVNNDWELAVTYSVNLYVPCVSGQPDKPYCTEIMDYCLPASVPPDYDPQHEVDGRKIINQAPYFIEMDDCYRPHGAAIGTAWQCFDPGYPGWIRPRGTAARRMCTNADKGTHGDFPGPW